MAKQRDRDLPRNDLPRKDLTRNDLLRKDLPSHPQSWPSQLWSYALLLAVIVFFGLIRLRLLNFPLERDEGEYAYGGQLILRHISPYQLCYTMKLPGTAATYAFFEAIFGQSVAGIHLGLLLVNSLTIVLIYFLGKRLFGSLGGVVASASFALLSLEPSVLGFSAHATQFVILPATAGVLILLRAIESERLLQFFASGILLGLAMLMKQPGIFFIVFGIVFVVLSGFRRKLELPGVSRQAAVLFFGAVLPFALTCLIFLRTGNFSKFWFWTFSYAREYENVVSFSDGWRAFWSTSISVVEGTLPLWLIAAVSPALLIWDSPSQDSKTNPKSNSKSNLSDPKNDPEICAKPRPDTLFLASFTIFSFFAVCLGFHFRSHYFVLMLPAVSLLCAAAVTAGTNLLVNADASRPAGVSGRWAVVPVALFGLCLIYSVVQESESFFFDNPVKLSRRIYGENPFPEALPISDFIKNHSAADDRIAVIGSEPEIYFYSRRLSATGYIYMYPLMEPQPFAPTMQREMISEIEAAKPRFLVFVDSEFSWLRGPSSDTTVFQWLPQYLAAKYHVVGVADILPGGTEYHWDDAATYRPSSGSKVLVFDRN